MSTEKTPYKAIQEELNRAVKLSPLNSDQIQNELRLITSLFDRYSDDIPTMVESYENRCLGYIKTIKDNNGTPVQALGDDRSTYVIPIKGDTTKLWLDIDDLCSKSIQNFKENVEIYRNSTLDCVLENVSDFYKLLMEQNVTEKIVKDEIKSVCQSFRMNIKWAKTFNALTAGNFESRVDDLLKIQSGAIAAQWCYNNLDEDQDYPIENHKSHDHKIFIVRGSWADEGGYLSGDITYLDTVMSDLMTTGCSCYLTFFFNVSDLPKKLQSEKYSELRRKNIKSPPISPAPAENIIAPKEYRGLSGMLKKLFGA
ncbi:hypothetical protein [Gluconobacter sphaericus]|uniref:Uncharacterized protein n=1 Tax=Gluconobacter sphaericus NBRC 12467 TaxID=1307951 RepID=A0AA37SM00_9PROT|nr:hypothetical protein [Gluconobacter sphaericus]MBF0886747.1 hypothetical protein [Gluconobacter sphaericus]GBR56772.1 hypothetical protein AA12467_2776 [Gluconobacter sphaericus NBRC 12467]GEB43543.1 hypothetical protein GSP01_23250 [Gluconobacter sphaericus NBRC 12467]GLQ85769.1 hypothetical protein GCM10007872_26790 [Gluconobacter sphaericus NBRC 12467]